MGEHGPRSAAPADARSGLSATFVAEPLRSAFDTNGAVLTVSPDLWGDYQRAAEALAKKVAHDPQQARLLAPAQCTRPTDTGGRGKAFVQTFGLRAFRRPLTTAERRPATWPSSTRARRCSAAATPFADGVELVLAALLQSPDLPLSRRERARPSWRQACRSTTSRSRRASPTVSRTPCPTTRCSRRPAPSGWRTATACWSQAQRLLGSAGRAADGRRLPRPAPAHARVRRHQEGRRLSPLFPAGVGADLKQEALNFVKDVVFGQSKGVTELLTAPYTFANSRVAKMYGLTATTPAAGRPDPFVRVELDPTQRAGLLTQVGFLAANGEGATPNIIIRGVRMARDVLCLDLPPPPDAMPPLPALLPNSTNRQRVEDADEERALQHLPRDGHQPARLRLREPRRRRPLPHAGERPARRRDRHLPARRPEGHVRRPRVLDEGHRGQPSRPRLLLAPPGRVHVRPRHRHGRGADANLIAQAGARSKNAMSVKDLILELVTTDAFVTRMP